MIHARALLFLAPILVAACGLVGRPQTAPLLPGTQDCIGLDRVQCLTLLDSVKRGGAVGNGVQPTVVGWRIRCTSEACDRNHGETEVTVTWSDGSTEVSSMGWMGDLGPPGEPEAQE